MQPITNIRKLTGFLLLACIVQACHSAANAAGTPSQPLMCYVCENCAKITKQTPLKACDADFFDKSSTIQDPTTTTTAEPSTTTVAITTTIAPTTTTSVGSTEMATTEAGPTAPTVGPTTTVPTPPNVPIVADMLEVATGSNNNTERMTAVNNEAPKPLPLVPTTPIVGPTVTVTKTPNVTIVADISPKVTTSSNNNMESTTAVNNEASKTLPLVNGNYTYHCYSVQKKVNGVEQMERGCTRVTTLESVCQHLNVLNNGTKLSKCVPCTNNSCNGSSALGVSIATLLFTLIAALLSRQ